MSEIIKVKAGSQEKAMRLRNAVAREFPDATIVTSWPGYSITTTAFRVSTSISVRIAA